LDTEDSVTALSFAPYFTAPSSYLLAVGHENGSIVLEGWKADRIWTRLCLLDNTVAHHLTVRRLAFRPKRGCAGDNSDNGATVQLASAGADHHVRVYNIKLDLLLAG